MADIDNVLYGPYSKEPPAPEEERAVETILVAAACTMKTESGLRVPFQIPLAVAIAIVRALVQEAGIGSPLPYCFRLSAPPTAAD